MERTVFHGATCVVDKPLSTIGRSNLDFGQGFYLTTMETQAVSWAQRIVNIGMPQYLNVYKLDSIPKEYRQLVFAKYDKDWLDFIVASRTGKSLWKGYDYIEGGIADDRVINTVEDYINGDIPADFALKRLSEHRPNNQICLLSQKLIDECLHYVESRPLNEMARKGVSC